MKKTIRLFSVFLLLTAILFSISCSSGEDTLTTVSVNALNQLRGDVTSSYSGGGDGGVLAARADNSIVLYTPDWYSTTMANDESSSVTTCEVVIDPSTPIIRSDSTITAKVIAIYDDTTTSGTTSETNTARAPGPESQATTYYGTEIDSSYMVLSGYAEGATTLAGLTVGQTISLTFDIDDDWEDVITSFGGGRHDGGPLLVENGAVVPEKSSDMQSAYGSSSWYDDNPRTAIGIKADGSYFLFTVDGRNANNSVGLPIENMKQLLVDLGAQTAFNLDGGGSTQFVANINGTLTLKNTPSIESTVGRAVAQGVFVVAPTSTLNTNQTAITGTVDWSSSSGYSGTTSTTSLATGITWTYYELIDASSYQQNIHVLLVDPSIATKARIVLGANGNYLYGKSTKTNVLTKANFVAANQIYAYESVIGGTNGDFYGTKSYTPVGFTQQDGRWLSSGEYGVFETSTSGLYTKAGYVFGVTDDGTVKIGQPTMSISLSY